MQVQFPVTRKAALAELKRENRMRLKVYGRGKEMNMSMDQKRWYQITCHLEQFFEGMTDGEFNRFMKRKADIEKQMQAQQSLF
ncbi:MAG: hypothetical protein AAGG68_28760 [Bacteroidota bacterium]